MAESQSSGSASEEDLVAKRGATVTSVVWKWFGYKRSDLQQSTIISKICKKTVTAKGGNTNKLVSPPKAKSHT